MSRVETPSVANASISLSGARANNLQGLSCEIPLARITVVSGHSGSGKSTLLHEVLAAEHHFRIGLWKRLEAAGSDLEPLQRPAVDVISNMPPVVELDSGPISLARHSLASLLNTGPMLLELFDSATTRICPRCQTARETAQIGSFAPILLASLPGMPVNICAGSWAESGLSRLQNALPGAGLQGREVIIDRLSVSDENRYRLEHALILALQAEADYMVLRPTQREAEADQTKSLMAITLNGNCAGCGFHFAKFNDALVSLKGTQRVDGICSFEWEQRLSAEQSLEMLSAKAHGISLKDVLYRTPGELMQLLKGTAERLQLVACLKRMMRLGLEQLPLARHAAALSRGERYRAAIVANLQYCGGQNLLLLDEPGSILSGEDLARLWVVMADLAHQGHTVLMADLDPRTRNAADYNLVLGPGGGDDGGSIVEEYRGNGSACLPSCKLPVLAKGSSTTTLIIQPTRRRECKFPRISLPLRQIVTICGPSGCGKNTLLFEVIAPLLAEDLKRQAPERKVVSESEITRVQSCRLPSDGAKYSSAAAFLQVWGEICDVFSNLEVSRVRGYTRSSFQRDEAAHTLDALYKGMNIAQIKTLRLGEAAKIFANHRKIYAGLGPAVRLGLEHLELMQPLGALGQAQFRLLSLAKCLRPSRQQTVFMIERPCFGLCSAEIENLGLLMQEYCSAGHSFICVEHRPEFLSKANYILELGLEGLV